MPGTLTKNHKTSINNYPMAYTLNKKTTQPFEEVIKKVTDELKNEGFSIITEIDLSEKFKEKLNVDFRKYKILGACNPAMAHLAIQIEPNIGVMLPCNILVQETEDGEVEIASINPLHSIGNTGNEKLTHIASEVTERLQMVIDRI